MKFLVPRSGLGACYRSGAIMHGLGWEKVREVQSQSILTRILWSHFSKKVTSQNKTT